MEDGFITVKWGNTIHNDGSILKRIVYKFDTLNGLKMAWDSRNKNSSCDYEADTLKLTIECREWVNSEEYFTTLEEEE